MLTRLNKRGYRDCLKCQKRRSLARSKNPGSGKGSTNRNKTHCMEGHLLDGPNVRISVSYGKWTCRGCKTCQRNKNRQIKIRVIEAYGGKCMWEGCDIADPDMLTVDHVENNGAEERRNGTHVGGFAMQKRVIKEGFPDKYQILCANHNLKKELLRRAKQLLS